MLARSYLSHLINGEKTIFGTARKARAVFSPMGSFSLPCSFSFTKACKRKTSKVYDVPQRQVVSFEQRNLRNVLIEKIRFTLSSQNK